MSKPNFVFLLVLAGVVTLILLRRNGSEQTRADETPGPMMFAPNGATVPMVADPAPSFLVVGSDPLLGRVGEGLNAVGGSGKRDLQILQGVFNAWRTNAPGLGNPVGNNVEITAALTGRNPWAVAIVPPDHPAINDRGELCDRWGTPLFFHQLSGERMELWSNGPDQRRGTADDVVLTP